MIPAWDSGINWDTPGMQWDVPYVSPDVFTASKQRTMIIMENSSIHSHFSIDPHAKLDYTYDWTQWLPPDDYIVSGTLRVTKGSLEITALSPSNGKVTFWAQNADGAKTVEVLCRVSTVKGRVDDRTMYLTVKER